MSRDPDLPLVHAIAWFDGRYGYNIHTRNLFDQLSRRLPVVASPLIGREGPVAEDRSAILRHFGNRTVVSVALLYGSLTGVLEGAPGPRVAYTVWEASRLPDDWLKPLLAADRVWTPTAWGARTFAENGIPPARIDVVPEGVDPATFHPDVAPTSGLGRSTAFRFLAVGRWEARKGIADLVRVFDRTFADADNVELVLAGLAANQPDLNVGGRLRALRLRRPDRLKIIPHVRAHETFAGLYTACDAFVAPFRAEGWGLPVIEAMACGLPTIVTGYSGPTEFVGPYAWRIDHRLVPVEAGYLDRADGDCGVWAEPDWRHLADLMRHLYENRSTTRDRARAGSEHVRTAHTWERSAAVADRIIRRLAEG